MVWLTNTDLNVMSQKSGVPIFPQQHAPSLLINMLLESQIPNCILSILFFLNHGYPEVGDYREEGRSCARDKTCSLHGFSQEPVVVRTFTQHIGWRNLNFYGSLSLV